MNQHTEYLNIIEEWILSQVDFFKNLPALPAELQDDLDELRIWNNKLLALYNNRDYYRMLAEERDAAQARIEAIVERQRIATEREMAEHEYAKWQRELEAVKARIDRITGRIIQEMRARRERAKREAKEKKAAEAVAYARKMKEDLRVWEEFKRRMRDIPVEGIEESHAEVRSEDIPLPPPIEKSRAVSDYDQAVWEAYIRGEKLPSENGDEKSPEVEAQEIERKLAEEERIAREIAMLRERESASEEENQAAWDEFVSEMGED